MKNQMRFFQVILLFSILLTPACSLREVDTKIGEMGEKLGSEGINNQEGDGGKEHEFTDEQKDRLEKWLSENKLNNYGEAIDTVYEKGAPFINENKDVVIDRFKYILENNKDILDKIK